MKYKVISSFVERDANGEPTGNRIEPGAEVELNAADAERLIKARCVEPITEQQQSNRNDKIRQFGRRRA